MTMDRTTRVDRVIPELFAELAAARTPDYLEAAIERASSRPQRPAWTFPGRWTPMDISTRAASAPWRPWRTIGIVAIIAVLIAATLAVYIGSQRTTLPEPFGLAGNGDIVVSRDGDIVTIDPVTGSSTTIVGGPEIDGEPVWSLDGATIGFVRNVEGEDDQSVLMVANADGSGLVQATRGPLSDLQSWSFSPDGQELLVSSMIAGTFRVSIHAADGSREPRTFDAPVTDDDAPRFRPPDGGAIVAVVAPPGAPTRQAWVIDVETGETVRVIDPPAAHDLHGATWTPSGKDVVIAAFTTAGESFRSRMWIAPADGSDPRAFGAGRDATPTAMFQASEWSNDWSRIVVQRSFDGGVNEESVVLRPDGDESPVVLACGTGQPSVCPGRWIWSPDDTQLLGVVEGDDGTYRYLMADPATGTVTEAPWSGTSEPNWQRVGLP